MKSEMIRKITVLVLAAGLVFGLAGCGKKSASKDGEVTPGPTKEQQAEPSPEKPQNTPTEVPRTKRGIIDEMLAAYGAFGGAAKNRVNTLLSDLKQMDPADAERWQRIVDMWQSIEETEIYYDCLPDGLPDTDELCIVALGFQLASDGSMLTELKERLKVLYKSANKYPNALIVCTGGGTAADNPEATEAGKMAEWLIAFGIAPERIIVEDKSITTAQNAIYTLGILHEKYPQVKKLAIISSDYHIATGVLVFEAESMLHSASEEARVKVVSNAAWDAPTGTLSRMFQAGALIEISGNIETAFDIYYDNYDIHELPPLDGR